MRTRDAQQRLSLTGQLDLGAAIEAGTGETLWSVQQKIATKLSVPRAKVAVPSCNASGKTYLAARLALAFYHAFTPGTPCIYCGNGKPAPCRGSKVITTSSKWEHLRDNMWGELRTAYARMVERGTAPVGRLFDGDLRLVESESNHYIIGQSSATAEGLQGAHAAHKLIIGDEATSVDDEVQLAITRLLASSDSRILLIYNPTTPDTYASKMARSASFETIRVRAWDTPAWTGDPMPPGANLITKAFVEDLIAQGMGPGTFEWQTSIEALDWDLGDDLLIPSSWYDLASKTTEATLGSGVRQLGVDIAAYGSDSNTIGIRDGNQLIDLRTFPSMRPDDYVHGPVMRAVMDIRPDVLVFDGDGVGAGAVGEFDDLRRFMPDGGRIIPFRGGKGAGSRFLNQRSMWYWHMRTRFENRGIEIIPNLPKLEDQLTDLHYSITPKGQIRVETKQEMRKRGRSSPDEADGAMYAFAYSDFLKPAEPGRPQPSRVEKTFGVKDNSDAAHWERVLRKRHKRVGAVNPVLGVSDG